MSKKTNVLEAWIMIEHLSEGSINLKDKSIKRFDYLKNEDYYELFKNEIKSKKIKNDDKAGIIIYLDIFSFNEVIDFLRKKYKLAKSVQELSVDNKFSIALSFDNKLRIIGEKTFITESYYIRKNKEVPKESEFLLFEGKTKESYEKLFEYCDEENEYRKNFNSAILYIMKQNNIDVNDCRMKVLTNIKTESNNLHSFFIKDLEKAKNIKYKILDDYILGETKERIDLDSKKESSKFNYKVFEKILEPKNYPIARYPSNPSFALSFMQQVAVNLSIGLDNEQIRSVNGPPGTGKTTLLKDIFAELVVRQAYEIVNLSKKYIKGSEETRYWDRASIGIMPRKIAEKGIVVASSNNGAVQNIVNELPLISPIGKEFSKAIIDADYFRKIANSRFVSEQSRDKNGKLESNVEEDCERFWGLFSLEGGKKDNMSYIINVLKDMVDYLNDEYVTDEGIYQDFMNKYNEVYEYRDRRQKISKIPKKLRELKAKIKKESDELSKVKKQIKDINTDFGEKIKNIQEEKTSIETKLEEYKDKINALEHSKESVNHDISKLKKPSFFVWGKRRREYKEKIKLYKEELQQIDSNEKSLEVKVSEIKASIERLEKIKRNKEKYNREKNEEFKKDSYNKKLEIRQNEKTYDELKKELKGVNIKELDFNLKYEELQLSNPWFDGEYRILQSELFISALRVRKQFLYDNVKNIKAAISIWGNQDKYQGHKIVISEAWNWINMAIPVISSTFASFSRMCANMDEKTIGYLFIDEAGQALPQASVGAILRSRNVLVVGDPSQIKPVLTMDPNILNMLGEYYGVSQLYLSENASTQTLVDQISKYGFYKDQNKQEWVGIPLWVHRRCQYPMFTISNRISYGDNMVQAVKKTGEAKWFDISGSARDKYVEEQGVFLKQKIQEMISENPDIINTEKKDIVYVITPFKNVANQLSQELDKIGFTRRNNNKPTNIGTVHTFQGKEAPIVFLVLGADENSTGAANWAMGTENPNIMNVAVTRAKEKFYIIGDKKLYLGLRSKVIKDTCEIIENYN